MAKETATSMKDQLLAILILSIFVVTGCGSEPQKKNKKPSSSEPTVRLFFEDGNTSLDLPEGFRKTSHVRLEKDLDYVEDDVAMKAIQDRLAGLEFNPGDVNVFLDTSAQLHLLIIVDDQPMPLDKETGQMLRAQIDNSHVVLEHYSPELDIEKIETVFKQGQAGKYFKFKYKLNEPGGEFYKTSYLLTTDSRTYGIHEFSKQEKDVEQYLAKLKD